MPEWVLWPLATKTWICKHKLYSPKFSTRTADLALVLALAPMPWKTRHHGTKSTTRAQAMLSRKQSEAVLPKSTSRSHKTQWWLARWLSWEFSRMSQPLHLMYSRVRTALLVRTVATVGYSRTQIKGRLALMGPPAESRELQGSATKAQGKPQIFLPSKPQTAYRGWDYHQKIENQGCKISTVQRTTQPWTRLLITRHFLKARASAKTPEEQCLTLTSPIWILRARRRIKSKRLCSEPWTGISRKWFLLCNRNRLGFR